MKQNLPNSGLCSSDGENEKRDTYLDLARDLKKKLWNMNLTMTELSTKT